jgi:endonuclease YncB( thermonuclease family)
LGQKLPIIQIKFSLLVQKLKLNPAWGMDVINMGVYLLIYTSMNEILLEQGLARVAYIYAPNTQYVDEFYAIQKKAQKKGVGIWSIENYAQEDGYRKSKR